MNPIEEWLYDAEQALAQPADVRGAEARVTVVGENTGWGYTKVEYADGPEATPPQSAVPVPDNVPSTIASAAESWIDETFDDELLIGMEAAGLISQAEGFKLSMVATLVAEIEGATTPQCQEAAR